MQEQQVDLVPDLGAARAHLFRLFGGLDLHPGILFEIRAPDTPILPAFFPCTEQGIEDAVKHAAAANQRGYNVYVGVNPRKPGSTHGRTEDVEIALCHFVDMDDEGARERLNAATIPPSFVVRTGSKPHERMHAYWMLDRPDRDLRGWRQREEALVASFKGDHKVVDAPRILRLAGMINYPPEHKKKQEHITERVVLFPHGGKAVTPEVLASAYGAAKKEAGTTLPATLPAPSAGALTPLARMLKQVHEPNEWHDSVLWIVDHFINGGRSDAEILVWAYAFRQEGWTLEKTVADMRGMIRTARAKWNIPEPTGEGEVRKHLRTIPDLDAMPEPEWLVDGLLSTTSLAVIYGQPRSLKTFAALDWMLCLATGRDWHGRKTKQGMVVYALGEGVATFKRRIKAWRIKNGVEGGDIPFLVYDECPNVGNEISVAAFIEELQELQTREERPIVAVVIDTVARAMPGLDENSSKDMGIYVRFAERVKRTFDCHVLSVHHSGKDDDRGMRGSSALLAAVDTCVWCKRDEHEDKIKLVVQKQKDADEGPDINLRFREQIVERGIIKHKTSLVLEMDETPLDSGDHSYSMDDAMKDVAAYLIKSEQRKLSQRKIAAGLGWTSDRKTKDVMDKIPFHPDGTYVRLNEQTVKLVRFGDPSNPRAGYEVGWYDAL